LVRAQQFGPLPSDVMQAIAEQMKRAGFARPDS
jgi:hypothetical protein